MNYENDLRIDETALDLEWLEQPVLMMKYVRHSSRARMQLDEAKQSLDIVKAEVDMDVRENPTAYISSKVTEGSIASAVLTDDRYKKAYQKWLDAKFESDMAQGAVRAFEQRKDALENLGRLYGMSYFAGPKMPYDLSRNWEKKANQERVDAGVASKLTRKT